MELLNSLDSRLSDKRWRMNNLYKIITEIDGVSKLVTFKFNDVQDTLFEETHPNYIIPKSRQLGITTYHVIFMLDDVLFKSNYTAVLQADEREKMDKIFQKAQIAWREFPKELKQMIGWEEVTDNKNTLRFNNYSSFITTLSARSGTTDHLHISELSRIEKEYPEKAEEIRTGSIPSVVQGGRVTIESTVEMPGGYFVDLYNNGFDEKKASTSNKDFKRFFFTWKYDKRFVLHNPALYLELPIKYLDYQKENSLTDDQITWYYATQKAYSLTDQEMRRQYPVTVEEAMSSNVDAFFDQDNIKQRKTRDVHSPLFEFNGWKIFEKFIPGHAYAVGADPTEGIGRDSSTGVIIDFSHRLENLQIVPKVVATFKSNRLDPLDFAELLIQGGVMFGNAIIVSERNNMGHAVIGRLKEKYRNIYQQRVKDYVEDREIERYGFNTTSGTKPALMSELRQVIHENGLIIPDSDILSELELYGLEDYKRIKNDPNITNHFDLVMGLALAWEMRFSVRPSRGLVIPHDEPFDRDELI